MDAFRRTRYAVTLLILFMALFVSAETAFIQNVKAVPSITLSPTSAPVDTNVLVAGNGFTATGSAYGCTITSAPTSIIGSSACTIDATGMLSATGFTIRIGAAPGTYTVTVTGQSGNSGSTPFTVTSPSIKLSPVSQRIGGEVLVNGTGFSLEDGSCSISSPTNPSVITISGCSVTKGTGGTNNTEGSFIVGNVPTGQYTIEVTGCPGNSPCSPSAGDFAQAVLEVSGGAQLFLIPSKGPVGQHVSIEGGFFSASDTTCSISSPSSGSVVVDAGCVIISSSSIKNVTGSFVVGNVPEGQYVIQVTGNTGDFAQAVFNVTAGAFIQLGVNGIFVKVGQVASGTIGTHVSIEGSQFLPNDALNSATCSVGSPSNGNAISNAGCSFFKTTGGFVNVTGSFVVGNVPEGQYVIQVSGSAGDSAEAVFNVTAGAFIQLGVNGIFSKNGQVTSGPIGTHVSIEGSNFLANDAFNSATCSLGSPSNGAVIANGACSFFKTTGGFVNVTGSFVVGNVPEGQYVIQVSGSAGDSAQAVFNVTAGAFIQLGTNGVFVKVGKVASGPTGTHVSIEGSQFLANDAFNSATCSVSSPTSGSVIVGGACSFFKTTGGFVNVTGSFIVGNVAEGQYVIQVSGSAGDSAQAVFNVTSGAFIQLGVNGVFAKVGQVASGPIGTHVSIEGSQFLPNDALNSATCSIGSSSNGNVIQNGACSFFKTTGGFVNVTGSFVVGNVPEGQYVIQVSGSAGDSAEAVFNVTSGAFIQLGVNGIFSKVGKVASGPIGTHVSIEGSNFLANDAFNSATCSIGSPSNGNAVQNGACSFFKTTTGLVNATGSFVIGNVPEGQYVIQVSGSAGDSAQAILNVTAGAFIQLGVNGVFAKVGQAASGPIGTHVSIEGSQFLANDAFNSATCSLGSPTSGSVVLNGACSFFKTTTGLVNVTGSFVVGNVQEGQYVIQVSGSAGDSAQAIFNVTAGAFIQLGVSIGTKGVVFARVGQVASGPTGTSVSIEGSNFLPGDAFNSATCSISSPTSSSIIQGAACSFFKTNTGLVNATGSFLVGNVHPGQYVIQVSGSAGDSAQAIFNVTSGPFIQLRASGFPGGFASVGEVVSGPIGTSVAIEGSFFTATATTCSISSPTSSAIIQGAGCSIFIPTSSGFIGFANVTGSFIVGNVLPGQYVIQVTDNTGSFAQAIFNVTTGPRITLSPSKTSPGHFVNFTGKGFLPTDTICTVSSPGSGAVLGGSAACAITFGKGNVSGSFLVGNVLPGEYVIQVTGNQGDFAQAVLTVTGGPKITLTPSIGTEGTSIQVNGTGFLITDQSCSISSISTPNPILLGTAACAITVGTGNSTGSFIIGPIGPGEYVIEVTGCAGNNGCAPSVGDFAQAVVTVVGNTPEIDLFPTNATNGATVVVHAYGLSPSDTGCIILAYNGTIKPANQINTLIGSSTCSIVSPQTAAGTFVVGPFAVENAHYNVTVKGTPNNDILSLTPGPKVTFPNLGAPFGVLASITVTPTSGTVHTVFTFTGSGFDSDATTCSATVVPAFAAPGGSFACAISTGTGQVFGSVTPPTTALAGTYGVEVGDNGKTRSNATGIFTIGTPSAILSLNPASVDQGQPVGFAATGLNPQDAYCVIYPQPPAFPIGPVPPGQVTCQVTGGFASGSFVVSSSAPGGYYLITVIGCSVAPTNDVCPAADTLDFASNFLGVTLASTVTTFSTTTTSSTSTTSMTTTTTSVATTFSFSTTTYSTTGIFFTTYTHFTASTVSGQTTTTQTSTTSTTQTQTTVTVSTTTSFTTVPCGPLPCGFAVQPTIQSVNPAPGIDSTGLLAALLLVIPMLLRRLFG